MKDDDGIIDDNTNTYDNGIDGDDVDGKWSLVLG